MKIKLLPLLFVLGGFAGYAQVGIGTPLPNSSSQLDIVAANKGLLITRVNLQSTTSMNPIINSGSLPSSLMVFNEATAGTAPFNVTPGYYYWYDNKWNRVVVSSEITAQTGTVIFNPTTNAFSYIDQNGDTQLINIQDIIKANETITTMVNAADGKHTYTNEAAVPVVIDVVADVVTNASTIFTNTDVVNQITNIANSAETITTMVNAADGKHTYTNEDAVPVVIDVVADVTTNASTIFTNTDVVNQLTTIIKGNETLTSLAYDGTANTLTYKDEAGTSTVVNLLDLVGDAETQTTLVYDATAKTLTYNGESGTSTVINLVDLVGDAETITTMVNAADGKHTYTNEDAVPVVIDVVADVVTNASTIFSNTDVVNQVTNIANSAETITTMVNAADGKHTYTNEDAVPVVIDVVADVTTNASTIFTNTDVVNQITNLVKNNETLTSLAYDGTANTLTYKDEAGTSTVVNLLDLVGDAETQTTLVYDATAKTLTYNGESGTPTVINLVDLVGDTETITTMVNAADGKHTYTNEDAVPVVIDVVADVTTNASTIFTNTDVVNQITNLVKNNETLTSLAYDGTANTLTYKDEVGTSTVVNLLDLVGDAETQTTLVYDATAKTLTYNGESGTSTVINLVDLVGDAETITTMVNAADGKHTYTNEDAVPVVIDVVADVTTNASTIFNSPDVVTELNKIIKSGETATSLTYSAAANTLVYAGETATNTISLADITSSTPSTVLAVTGTGATFSPSTVNIVPSTVVGDVLTTSATGVVSWQAPAKPNVLGIKVIADDYTLLESDYTIIARGLTKDITITLPDAATNTGRILVINQLNVVKTDGTPVVVNFDKNVIYSDAATVPSIAVSLFGGVSSGSAKITLQSDGSNWYVITYTM